MFTGILDDTYALCEACELPLSSLLTLMDVYRKDLDYIVLRRLVDVSKSFLSWLFLENVWKHILILGDLHDRYAAQFQK